MWFWFGAAALFLLMEMVSGTFYLLLIALGLVASGVAAFLGWSLALQIGSGCVIALVSLVALYRHRKRKGYTPSQSNANVNPDIGKRVNVQAWNENGTTNVFYRGTNWAARIEEHAKLMSGEHTIIAVQGLTLILRPNKTNTQN